MDGFKHEDDWQAHPYGCECRKCEEKFLENKLKFVELFVEAFKEKELL